MRKRLKYALSCKAAVTSATLKTMSPSSSAVSSRSEMFLASSASVTGSGSVHSSASTNEALSHCSR